MRAQIERTKDKIKKARVCADSLIQLYTTHIHIKYTLKRAFRAFYSVIVRQLGQRMFVEDVADVAVGTCGRSAGNLCAVNWLITSTGVKEGGGLKGRPPIQVMLTDLNVCTISLAGRDHAPRRRKTWRRRALRRMRRRSKRTSTSRTEM